MSVRTDRVIVLARELSVSRLGSVGNIIAAEHHAEIGIGTSPAPCLSRSWRVDAPAAQLSNTCFSGQNAGLRPLCRPCFAARARHED